jgi:hypothetical protein
MTNFETFKLSELRLDEHNYRIGQVHSQRDAIHAIIADQKHKLVNLAKDIIREGGLSPGEPIWVARDPATGSYIVVEGNRRVTALKLMENPSLADGTVIEKEIRILGGEFAKKPIRELTAVVFPTYEAAGPWRRRRHLSTESGVGLERWTTLAKARADRDHGVGARRSLAVIEYLQDDSDEWDAIADALDARWTTVDRVLNAKAMRTVLGVQIDPKTGEVTFENGNVAAGKALLRQILGTMAMTSFKFSDVEKEPDRENFLTRFVQGSVKAALAPPGQAAPPAPTRGSPSPPPSTQPQPQSPTTWRMPPIDVYRKTLAPKSGRRTFRVEGSRLSGIYNECRKIIVNGNENAAAFLLRVFIELSSEAFLTEKSVPFGSKLGKKGIASWDDIGIPLSVKVQAVIDEIDSTKKAKEFQRARIALDQQSHSVSSINTLHGYFHNRQLRPDAADVIEAWNDWEPYLSALHNAR